MSQLHKFIFHGLPVRGALVRLTDAWQEILRRRASNSQTGAYLAPVVNMLGQMSGAATLMRSSIKFDGALLLQVAGSGPVSMAVVEVDAGLHLRATANWSGPIAQDAALADLINPDGAGRCAITLDPRHSEPGRKAWQGVVPLTDATGAPLTSVAQFVEGYMQQSEQLPTTLVLAANAHAACGLMLQRMPGQASDDADAFVRLSTLVRSLDDAELLQLGAEDILHRLFWNEPLRLLEVAHPEFACSCSRERVAAMLKGLGEDEVQAILDERGNVEVGCEFCGTQQRFDAVDVAALFGPAQPVASGSVPVQ